MAWWLTAKPGDRVVCVGWDERCFNKGWLIGQGMQVPKKGPVYTIRNLGPTITDEDRFALRLREIVNPPLVVEGIEIGEVCWLAEWFRPVVNRATDISSLTALLSGAPSSSGPSRGSADLECVGAGVDPRHEAEDDGRKAGAR